MFKACPPAASSATLARLLTTLLTLTVALTPLSRASRAAAATDPAETAASARYVLEQATTIHRDGRHNQLLKALRHLRDPQLEPLFARLSTAKHPVLQIHGILGLTGLQPERGVPLELLAQIDGPAAQAELITAAIDDDLLTNDNARQLLAWADLDVGVKLLIAAPQLQQGKFNDVAMLKGALSADRIARRALAAVMLLELKDPAATAALQELDRSDDPQRDAAIAMALRTAARHGFTAAGPWAYALAADAARNPDLALIALRAAMRLGQSRASELWQQRFITATDAAERSRLAFLALEQAPFLAPATFDPLIADAATLLQQIGRTGQAVASDSSQVPDHVVALVQQQHPLAAQWALGYATDHARPADAQFILLALVLAFDQGAPETKHQRFDTAAQAAQSLFEIDPATAASLLKPVLMDPATNPLLAQSILLAMLRLDQPLPQDMLTGLPDFSEQDSRHLALLLRARTGQHLSNADMRDLAVLVQGGGNLQSSLRVQAAWTWLKRTNQTDAALTQALRKI